MSEHTDIDRRVTVDFDHHSADIAPDPYPTYSALRERCPVAWSTENGGFWVLTNYVDVHSASRDDATFCSAPSVSLPEPPYGIRNVPLDTDNPETELFRKILLREYSPAAVKRMEPEIAALADELIDGFIESGECDLVTDYSLPLPARIIFRLIGFEEHQWTWYVERIHTIIHGMATEAAMVAGLEVAGRISEEMARRRSINDFSGQLGMLMEAKVGGEPMSDADVLSYVILLIFGGLDTTSAALGNALILLDQDHELRRTLIDNPEKIAGAVEEFLRFQSPVQALGRTVARDVEVGGQQLRAGERALLVWASANRDEKAFDSADEFDIDRTPNRHLAFGVGLHRCLGSNLGRTMFRIMLDRFLARVPDYRLTEDPSRYRYTDAAIVFAVHHLPAAFTPKAR